MNLIQNYLEQVEAWLPKSADKDVLAELESCISDHLEEFIEQNERDANDDEIAKILKQIGSPKTVAARFGKQQFLIGPELYPMWRYSVRIALTLVFILFFINGLLRYISGSSEIFLSVDWFGGLLQLGLTAFALTTLIFAVLEYQGKTDYFKDSWDPLKKLSIKQSKSDQQDALTNVISDIVFLIIWNHWLNFSQDTVLEVASLNIQFHPVFHLLFWPVNILLLCSIALYGWQLFNQFWQKSTVVMALILDIAGLVIVSLLLFNAHQLQISGASEVLDVRTTEHVGTVFKVSLLVIMGFNLMDFKRHVKIFRSL